MSVSVFKRRRFCSKSCFGKTNTKYHDKSPNWRGGKVSLKCHHCSKTIERHLAQARRSFYHFCSKTCFAQSDFRPTGQDAHAFLGGKTLRRNSKTILGRHTNQQWEDMKSRYDFMCLCCKKKEPEVKLTKDHIIPVIQGGTNDIDNIQPLCQPCNNRKYDKHINFISAYSQII